MSLYEIFILPFVEFEFMRFALAAIVFLSLSVPPIGVFLVMRRMSLMGDAMSHAILPGVAIGFMVSGMSVVAMSIGGFIAGLVMAIAAGLASRYSNLKEDASFTGFYLTCLALGVILVSVYGNSTDLMHLLFGSVLAVTEEVLLLVAICASVTLIAMAVIYRPLLIESIDPYFLKIVKGKGTIWHVIFQVLVVINLVSGFQALGTLMAVGLMMLPAIAAKLWSNKMGSIMLISVLISILSGYGGLLLSYYVNIPSGPSIIFLCGIIYIVSIFIGKQEGVLVRLLSQKHHKVL